MGRGALQAAGAASPTGLSPRPGPSSPAGRRSCRYRRWSAWSLKTTLSPPSSPRKADVHAAAVLVHERPGADAGRRDVGDLAVRRPPDHHVAAVLQGAQFGPVQALAHALRPHRAHAALGDELRGDGGAPGPVGRDGADVRGRHAGCIGAFSHHLPHALKGETRRVWRPAASPGGPAAGGYHRPGRTSSGRTAGRCTRPAASSGATYPVRGRGNRVAVRPRR